MAHADLTPEQKTQLQEWLQVVRPLQGEMARMLQRMQVAKDAHASHVGAILAELASDDVIPNESGLAGATAITKANLTTILVDLNTVLTDYDTDEKRQLWTKFCGAVNMIG